MMQCERLANTNPTDSIGQAARSLAETWRRRMWVGLTGAWEDGFSDQRGLLLAGKGWR
jgi:hypothetical protein